MTTIPFVTIKAVITSLINYSYVENCLDKNSTTMPGKN